MNIKAVIRGHLAYLNIKPKELEKASGEFYKTAHWSIIINHDNISFKNKSKKFKIRFDDIKEFTIKDTKLFRFIMLDKKKAYFKVF